MFLSKNKSLNNIIENYKLFTEMGNNKKKMEYETYLHIKKLIHDIKKEKNIPYLLLKIGENEPIKINGIRYKEKKQNKSDVELTYQANPIIYISLKGYDNPSNLFGYSGIAKSYNPFIGNHPETKSFVAAIKEKAIYPIENEPHKKMIEKHISYTREIVDTTLYYYAMFGKNYDSNKNFGVFNVNCVLFGNVDIIEHNGIFELTAKKIFYNNGKDIKFNSDNRLRPVFSARNTLERGEPRHFIDANIYNTRLEILPIGSLKYTPVEI